MSDPAQPKNLADRIGSPSPSDWTELGMTAYFAGKQVAIDALGPRLGWYALGPVGWVVTLGFELDDIAAADSYREVAVQSAGAIGAIAGGASGFVAGGVISGLWSPPVGTIGSILGATAGAYVGESLAEYVADVGLSHSRLPSIYPNAYRVVMIEAGHIGQNIMLAGTAHGLSACPPAALCHSRMRDCFGLTGVTNTPVYALTLAVPTWADPETASLDCEVTRRPIGS